MTDYRKSVQVAIDDETTNTDHLDDGELERAELMFQEMLGADDGAGYDVEMSLDEIDVGNLHKNLYQNQMTDMKEDFNEDLVQKDEEIEKLRAQLAAAMKNKVQEVKENLKEEDDGSTKSPIIQKHNLDGTLTTILICHFYPNSGRIGIKFKRFKDGFFVTGVLPDSQAARFAGLNRGLLIFEVVSWSPLQKMGMTIPAQRSSKLVKRIMEAFNAGYNVTIKFVIPPVGADPYKLQQHVIRPSNRKRK